MDASDGTVTLLSHSRMNTYSSCPEKFRLLYIEEVPPEPQGSFIGGITVHNVIEWVEKEQNPLDANLFGDFGLASRLFQEQFTASVLDAGGENAVRWPRSRKEDAAWWARFGPGMLRNYHGVRLHDQERGWAIIEDYTEAELTLPIEELDTLLRGRTDAVMQSPDEGPIIRDYKTGISGGPHAALQLALYSLMLEEHFGYKVPRGELVYLRKVPNIQRFDLEPLFKPALDWMYGVIEGMRSQTYFLVPSNFCVSCSVRRACAWGSTLEGGE